MDDLQLLELLERAQKKQRGPAGPAGIGIESISQFEENSFTIKLTTGEHKKIALQPGADGAVGPQGVQGERGEPGPAGRAGRDGAAGTDGAQGVSGRDGSFVDTAIVNSNGELLLGLSTGEVINCGRVVGPAGATGERGPTGLPGAAGKDGTAVLSGPRAPQQDDGNEGDFWIDISSAEFSFFKKNGEGWSKLAELRQVPRDLRVPTSGTGGGGSGGGGGKGDLQNTRTLPLINGGSTIRKQAQARGLPPVPGEMKTQEDANLYFLECIQNEDVIVSDSVPRPPYQEGQLWFSTNPEELTLYIYDGAVWVPAAPPVSLDGIEASLFDLSKEISEVNNRVTGVNLELEQEVAYKAGDRADNLFQGRNEFDQPVRVAPGTQGNEAITYEQLANLAGEIDEIKVEKEKGEWIAEIPSTGSDGGRDVIYDGAEFPGGGVSTLDIGESGGADGKGFVYILCDLGDDPEAQEMAKFLTELYEECYADPDGFKDKYSFYCPWAADKGLAVREQPIDSVVKSSAMTYTIHFYGPVGDEKEASGKGIEFFTEANEGHRPPLGHFFMEAYQDKSAQEQVCADELAKCQTGDPMADSVCIRDFDTCMKNASDGWNPVSDFGEATAVVFHKSDRKNVTHSFDEVRAGDSIRITDTTTEHFLIAKIDSIKQTDTHIRFAIDNLSHIGGIENGSFCEIEFYNFSLTPGEPDLDAYVKKTGDTMSGQLIVSPSGASLGGTKPGNMLIVNSNSAGSIARFKKDGKDFMKVEESGNTSLENNKLVKVASPEDDTDGVNKAYVDNLLKYIFAPAKYQWRAVVKQSGAKCSDGYIHFKGESFADSDEIRISMTSYCKNFTMSKEGMADGKILYEREQGFNSAMVISGYHYDAKNNEWKWKGTSEIRKITIMAQGEGYNYLKINIDNQRYGNGDVLVQNQYYYTISGLF